MKIVISELPKKHLMRWDYIDNAGKGSRFVALNLSKSEMTMHFGEDPDEHLRVTGLDRFASEGLGEFSAFRANSDSKGKKSIDRVTFHLAPNSFNYEWEVTSDGQSYKTYSAFALKREVSSSAPRKPE
ncbi:hypothetical protein [Tunturibacter empetritectus]|uniref:Uncharacterized protein n=1 Tax=Tunturiibacter lichenicola TaxID=2051959 RepID=A0A7W8JB02_9BACT|nr:hypothetical protein [Edaphobacter lichenicola]MBB5345673.1 hypothetical protein [Edaphobacter lichenicola]